MFIRFVSNIYGRSREYITKDINKYIPTLGDNLLVFISSTESKIC